MQPPKRFRESLPGSNNPTAWLRPEHLQMIHMRVAGMSVAEIARFLQTQHDNVTNVLNKESAQRYMLQLRATFATDLRPFMDEMREALEDDARQARVVARTVMDESFNQREDFKWAKLATLTAQDILDRAGAAAPKKIESVSHHSFGVDAETGGQIIEILKEDDAIRGPLALDRDPDDPSSS